MYLGGYISWGIYPEAYISFLGICPEHSLPMGPYASLNRS